MYSNSTLENPEWRGQIKVEKVAMYGLTLTAASGLFDKHTSVQLHESIQILLIECFTANKVLFVFSM